MASIVRLSPPQESFPLSKNSNKRGKVLLFKSNSQENLLFYNMRLFLKRSSFYNESIKNRRGTMKLEELLKNYLPKDDVIEDIGDFFSVFAQETRIKIIIMLSVSELNVNDLTRFLRLNQSTVSHQLRILKDRKIVKTVRKGKEIYYSIANTYVSEVLFSAIKATEENVSPLSERISRSGYTTF